MTTVAQPPPSESPPPGYQPASRRPIAGFFRRTADLAVTACLRLGVSPDAVSYSSIVAAGRRPPVSGRRAGKRGC